MFIKQQGKGNPLILLHGWGFNGNIWDDVATELAQNWRVYQVDLPGHGKSSLCEYSLPTLTDILLNDLPNNAVWIGWSLGGLLAMNIAIHHHIRGLILVSTSPRFVTDDNWPHAMTIEVLQQFSSQLQTDTIGTLRRFLALQVRGCDNSHQQLRNLNSFIINPPTVEALQAGLQLLQTTDLRSKLSQIDCQTLLCLGKRDKIVPVGIADNWQYQKTIIKSASHIPFLSHPKIFINIVRDFLKNIE